MKYVSQTSAAVQEIPNMCMGVVEREAMIANSVHRAKTTQETLHQLYVAELAV